MERHDGYVGGGVWRWIGRSNVSTCGGKGEANDGEGEANDGVIDGVVDVGDE